MNELKMVLQFVAILFLCYIIYHTYKYVISIKKKNRLAEFSINIDKNKNDSIIYSILFKTSNILESLVIFNGISRTYNEYIDEHSHLKKGMDYISIKVLLGLFFIILYLLLAFLYEQDFNVTLLLINFILGYVLPDFYCLYLSSKNRRITNDNVLNSIIIMSNSYKANRSTEQAIMDVIDRSDGPLKKEFSRVMNDIKLGIKPSVAFKRMGNRINNKSIIEISNYLESMNNSGISPSKVFEIIEHKLVEQERFKDEIRRLNSINRLTFIIFMILPLLFILYMMFIKYDLSFLFINNYGIFIFLIMIIIYLLYCFTIWKIANRGNKNE